MPNNSGFVVKIDYLMNIFQYITHDASKIIKILLGNKNTKCWHLKYRVRRLKFNFTRV